MTYKNQVNPVGKNIFNMKRGRNPSWTATSNETFAKHSLSPNLCVVFGF